MIINEIKGAICWLVGIPGIFFVIGILEYYNEHLNLLTGFILLAIPFSIFLSGVYFILEPDSKEQE